MGCLGQKFSIIFLLNFKIIRLLNGWLCVRVLISFFLVHPVIFSLIFLVLFVKFDFNNPEHLACSEIRWNMYLNLTEDKWNTIYIVYVCMGLLWRSTYRQKLVVDKKSFKVMLNPTSLLTITKTFLENLSHILSLLIAVVKKKALQMCNVNQHFQKGESCRLHICQLHVDGWSKFWR